MNQDNVVRAKHFREKYKEKKNFVCFNKMLFWYALNRGCTLVDVDINRSNNTNNTTNTPIVFIFEKNDLLNQVIEEWMTMEPEEKKKQIQLISEKRRIKEEGGNL